MHTVHCTRSAAPAKGSLAAILFALCGAQQAFAECDLASTWEVDSVNNLSTKAPIEPGDELGVQSSGTSWGITLTHHSAGGAEVSLCDELERVTETEIVCAYDDDGVPKRFYMEMIKGRGRDTASCEDGVPPWLSDQACEDYQCVILWSNRSQPSLSSGPGNPGDGGGTGGGGDMP